MSVVPDDIEDLLPPPKIRRSPLFSSDGNSNGSTVRIRKLNFTKKKNNNDCCGGSSKCACLHEEEGALLDLHLLDQTDDVDRFENNVVKGEEEEEDDVPPSPATTNDLNPAHYTIYLKTWGCSHNNSDSEYMGGLLAAHGFGITTTDYDRSNLVLLNSCTVKGPSEQHFKNEIDRAVKHGKHVVLAGCVSQSDHTYRKIASVIGVQQIDKVVEVVEETLKGNKLRFTSVRRNGQRAMPELQLPKIRKNELIEIVPISTGCLNNCTYCKTKLARGQLSSYPIDSIVSRITHVCDHENVREIWLTSEDLGAWGIDLGLTIVDLLHAIVEVLPSNVMLRLGMTNPPYILDHLHEIAKILSHPNVYEFLHIPVQSGSDSVLLEMKREYSRRDFERICDFMMERLPNVTIATDIICGYPTETEEDFNDTMSLVDKYKFPVLFINQFYPRAGTPAAKLKRIPTDVVKSRTRKLNDLFQSYTNLTEEKYVGTTQRVLVTELAHDGVKHVGHNKSYQQVLVDNHRVKRTNKNSNNVMGCWVDVRVVGVGKFSMIGGDAWIVRDNTHYYRVGFSSFAALCIFILLFYQFFGFLGL